jgi:omega-3 fatty acid desaturase (delta-15 desaturase)
MQGATQTNLPTLRELRAALPAACLRPSTGRSLFSLLGDLVMLGGLYALSTRVTSAWLLAPLCFAEGTLFWALFVIGHECGHGAFSCHKRLNDVVGHLTHTPLLVPYHAWRLSHRLHHRHVGDLEHDETWFPLTREQSEQLPWIVRLLRFRLFLLVFPLYLLRRTPARSGSHFDPRSDMFPPGARGRVRTSISLCAAMALLLLALAISLGPLFVVQYWLGPYLVFSGWLALVTYLHHTDAGVPWYRGSEWSLVRGALSTVDRHYGLFEPLHHHAGTHVVHHLFPRIPHYRLRIATEAVRPLLVPWWHDSRKPIWRALADAARTCHVVPSQGGRVFYEPLNPTAQAAGSTAGSRPATRW